MRQCQKCGTQCNDNNKFCTTCGTTLTDSQPQPQEQETYTQYASPYQEKTSINPIVKEKQLKALGITKRAQYEHLNEDELSKIIQVEQYRRVHDIWVITTLLFVFGLIGGFFFGIIFK